MDGWMWWRVVWVDAVAVDILKLRFRRLDQNSSRPRDLATNQEFRIVKV